jgi:hypothetical protein
MVQASDDEIVGFFTPIQELPCTVLAIVADE